MFISWYKHSTPVMVDVLSYGRPVTVTEIKYCDIYCLYVNSCCRASAGLLVESFPASESVLHWIVWYLEGAGRSCRCGVVRSTTITWTTRRSDRSVSSVLRNVHVSNVLFAHLIPHGIYTVLFNTLQYNWHTDSTHSTQVVQLCDHVVMY